MAAMGRAWAIRRTDTEEWLVYKPWDPKNIHWSEDFNDAHKQMGEDHQREFQSTAERLRMHGFSVEVVRLAFVEDPYTFAGRK